MTVDMNREMPMNNVVQVLSDNTTLHYSDQPVPVPEAYIGVLGGPLSEEQDKALIAYLDHQGWEVQTGWTAQHSYVGPVMHPKETIGARLAEHILGRPGNWARVTVKGINDENIGWALVFRPRFVATINTPGYLPQGEPAVFDTALEAWDFLLDERRSAEDEAGDDGYSATYNTIECIVAGNLDPADAGLDPTNMTGTILGDTPGCECNHDLGLAFSVELTA